MCMDSDPQPVAPRARLWYHDFGLLEGIGDSAVSALTSTSSSSRAALFSPLAYRPAVLQSERDV